MKEKESSKSKKRAYLKPETRVISADPISMVCATVTPNPGGTSGNSRWGNEEEHGGGSISFGNESTVTPAKWGVWEDEEE